MLSLPEAEQEPIEDVIFIEPTQERVGEAIELVRRYNEEVGGPESATCSLKILVSGKTLFARSSPQRSATAGPQRLAPAAACTREHLTTAFVAHANAHFTIPRTSSHNRREFRSLLI